MGLDTVELVIRFEDAFGIKIPDEVAAELTTPRQVTFYVFTQLNMVDRTTCMSQQAFYFLRRAFLPVLDIERSQFHPETNLTALIPRERRTQVWSSVRSQIGVAALPELVRPRWLFVMLTTVTLLSASAVFIYTMIAISTINAFVFSLLVAGVVGFASESLTRSWRLEFHRDYLQAGDLAKYLTIQTPHIFKKEWSREEVAETVRKVVIDQTGLTDFTEDSRFVQDMHLD